MKVAMFQKWVKGNKFYGKFFAQEQHFYNKGRADAIKF